MNNKPHPTWYKWLWRCLFILLICWLLNQSINHAFIQALNHQPAFTIPCNATAWAHRGQQGSLPPNSIAGIRAALAAGAGGIEVDIQYLPQHNRFVLAHDAENVAQATDSLITLDTLFQHINNDTYWWLDAKNLRSLWPWQAKHAVKRLQKVIRHHQRQNMALVESSNPLYLRWLAHAGIGTLLAIKPNEKKRTSLVFHTHLLLSKWLYSWGPFTGITMGYDRFTPKVRKAFHNGPGVWLSTFHEAKTAVHWLTFDTVKAVLIEAPPYPSETCSTIN